MLASNYLVIVAPYWWGSVPAMLKGWFDRVLVCGVTWDYGKFFKTGMMKGRKAILVVATGEQESAIQRV